MPKGKYNHKGKTNTNAITEINKAYSAEIQGYKERAIAYRKNRRYDVAEITKAIHGILDYIKECMQHDKPATISGMILASKCNTDFYYKAKAGDYDYIAIEYIENNNINIADCITDSDGLLVYTDPLNNEIVLSPISQIIEKCLLLIENDLQIRSLTDKSMSRTTGAIFNLKAVFNYNDKPETETKTVNNTLIVNASPEQTAKAMQLLLDNK